MAQMAFDPGKYGLTFGEGAARAALQAPQRVVFRSGNQKLTLERLHEEANRLANALIAKGLAHGDYVAVLLPTQPECLTATAGITRAGGTVAFLLPQYGVELVKMLQSTPPRWLIYTADYQQLADALIAAYDCEAVVLEDEAEAPLHWHELLATGSRDDPDVRVTPDDAAFILFTSGTTGTPKAVRRSHNSAMSHGVLYNHYLRADAQSVIGLMQLWQDALPAILTDGGCLVIVNMLQPREWLAAVERERITHTGGVPSLLQLWLTYPDWSEFDLTSIKSLVVGAATTPPGLHAQIRERAGFSLQQMYGSIEGGIMAVNDAVDGPQLLALGLPVDGKTFRILDENGNEAPRGQIGELTLQPTGAHLLGMMDGYGNVNEPSPWQNGWLHTGDLVYQGEDDYLYLVGRTYETINVAGHKVYAPEIERVLSQHADIAEVAVIGMPDGKRGEIVIAHVVPEPGKSVDISDLRAYCNHYLAAYKLPRSIIIQEHLPRTATGKVDKQALQNLA
jgi:acyl-CoA synthetase (AMP-forming)/AMP-acid ligase II